MDQKKKISGVASLGQSSQPLTGKMSEISASMLYKLSRSVYYNLSVK